MKEQRRDISKYIKDAGVIISTIGIENQSVQDKDMPFRIMGYDYGSYRGQIKTGIERYPVLSIVLYYGKKPWKEAVSIRERVAVPPEYENVFTDYRINLIDIPRLSEETRNQLTSDFRAVADFFANREKSDYRPSDQKLKHVEAVLQLLKVFTGDSRYEEIEDEIMKRVEKGEEVSMCEFAERMEQQGIAKGIIQGAVDILKDMKVNKDEIIEKISTKYNITEEEVKKYLN